MQQVLSKAPPSPTDRSTTTSSKARTARRIGRATVQHNLSDAREWPESVAEGCAQRAYLCTILIHRGFIVGDYDGDRNVKDEERQMAQQKQSRWRPTRQQVLWTIGIVVVLTIAVLIGYDYGITLWDWIKLLIVPTVLAGGGLWFNRQQRERELEIADRRTQDEALQAYLDQMSDMLIPNTDQPSLYKARPGDSLSSVARARTLTVLTRLDGDRKARVVQFLYESGLLERKRPILDLSGANLGQAYLRAADWDGANLRGANRRGADLSGAGGWTEKGLAMEMSLGSLARATIPNGQKYADWRKSKDRKEDG
jgi:hypothetical protein